MKVSEIFHSLSGEGITQGYPAIFLRLAGCNLNCKWCDTEYAKSGGEKLSLQQVAALILSHCPVKHIIITGGEPLLQVLEVQALIGLLDSGFQFTIETNGSLPVQSMLKPNVSVCMDVKLPSSGMQDKLMKENLQVLRETDEVKYVVADEVDWNYAQFMINQYKCRAQVCFSPVWGNQEWFQKLAELVLKEGPVGAKYSIQLHKVIWGNRRGV